jgi:hypothetical protein
MSNGENSKIITSVCIEEKKKIQMIIGLGFRPRTKYLPGQKFYNFGHDTHDTGKIKCSDVAPKVSL